MQGKGKRMLAHFFILSKNAELYMSEFRSLAYLSVYPFGPRFLLFTVPNTSLALAMSTSAVMPFRFHAQTPIFFIFHPEMNEARSTKHVVVTTD